MARRLWLRFLLWWNNVCPEHGVMAEGIRYHYCPECNARAREQKVVDLKKLQEDYNATKP